MSPLSPTSSALEAGLKELALNDESAPKKPRVEKESENVTLEFAGISLGKDPIQKILSYLPFQELLTFELVSPPLSKICTFLYRV